MASERHGSSRVAAVVLAAGTGSRFGGGKMLAPVEGRPILQHVLDRLAASDLDDVIVVLGEDASTIEAAIHWRSERRVRNLDPSRGLSSSLQVGLEAVGAEVDAAMIVLGDQPLVPPRAVRALLNAEVDDLRPVVVPVYGDDAGRNPVLLGRAGFSLVDGATGDRGLGPLLAIRPELVREIPIRVEGGNPDVDTQADHVALLDAAWAARVRASAEQVDRFREVPDGADFYAPVTGLFRADPRRTDEPVLEALLRLIEPGETWVDIGAGAGRYALPIALALAPSGGRVIALDASPGMLDALLELQSEHGVTDVEVIETRWPPPVASLARFAADVALIAHVGYDIESIGPFIGAMESVASRLCVAVLMERQPASIADPCWPSVHGESRVALPALPEFVEWLRARRQDPSVEMVERAPRTFASRQELEGFLRRQLWIEPGGSADRRFRAALDDLVAIDDDGAVRLRDQPPLAIGVVTWKPQGAGE
jgi:CTP:molybdopterin cytidylyltransferase MocA/SAM-dependent methyltransferase